MPADVSHQGPDDAIRMAAELRAAVLAVAQHADRAAFGRLFRHFAPRVKAYLMRLGADDAGAEDLMQDVMLTVWRRAPTYDPALAGVSTWIFTIARNRRIDAIRRGRRPEIDIEDPVLQPQAPSPPDSTVAVQQWEARISRAISGLPAEQAEMLRLAYFEDRSHTDIADALNLPLGTVKSRLRLAIGRLRSMFEPEENR
jgi:RNA polymerase sigma-70 factor (ECF subfamily)